MVKIPTFVVFLELLIETLCFESVRFDGKVVFDFFRQQFLELLLDLDERDPLL